MKGERLLIDITDVGTLAKGIVITGYIKSGRLSLNQTVYLHETTLFKPQQCTIVDIRKNDRFVSQAKRGDSFTSYILGSNANSVIIGKTYITGSSKPIKTAADKKKTIIIDDSEIDALALELNEPQNESKERATAPNKRKKIESVSSKEKELIECIQICLKSSSNLSATERYVLNKIAESYKISANRCEELINKCLKNFHSKNNIAVFRNAVLTCLLDSNYITETEHLLLERLRLSLNISEDVAYRLIYECNWSYSDILKSK